MKNVILMKLDESRIQKDVYSLPIDIFHSSIDSSHLL